MAIYKPPPLEERESEKVGPKNLIMWGLKTTGIAVGAGLLANVAARAFKIRIKAPKFLREFFGPGEKEFIRENPIPFLRYDLDEFGPREIGMLTGKVAGFASLFTHWRKKEETELGAADMLDGVQEAAKRHVPKEEIEKRVATTGEMLKFEHQKQQELSGEIGARVASMQHEGKVGALPQPEVFL